MQFASVLRDRVRSGEITSSVRIWQRPHVKAGAKYPLPPGFILVESIEEIGFEEISLEMAMESGFETVESLMATAKHGRGERVFLIQFRYLHS